MTLTVRTLTGSEAKIGNERVEELRMMIRGDVLTPQDPGYAMVRSAYNAMHLGKPALVVRPTGTADVIASVNFARENGLLVAVRGGGHSVAGLSSVDGGLLLDLALMNGVEVDPEAQTVRVQGGALVGDMDHETQAFGLVAPCGVVSDTGVAGLTLGGGEGWVRRKHGLSIDNLLSAQVVCADGQVRSASADSNPDLFWAIRGGGGNFGVVTSFTFRCHPVGPIVAFAGVFHPVEDAENVYRQFRDWAKTAPDEISALIGCTTLPASEHTPPEIHNTPFIVTGAVYSGDPDEGMKIIQPLREIGTPLVDISGPIPFVGVQAAFDEFFRRGTLRSYWKSTFVEELTDPILDIIVDKARNRPHETGLRSHLLHGRRHQSRGSRRHRIQRAIGKLDGVDRWQLGGRQRRRQGHLLGTRRLGRGARARNGFAVPEFHGRRGRSTHSGRRERFRKEPHGSCQDQGEVRPRQLLPPEQQHHPCLVGRPRWPAPSSDHGYMPLRPFRSRARRDPRDLKILLRSTVDSCHRLAPRAATRTSRLWLSSSSGSGATCPTSGRAGDHSADAVEALRACPADLGRRMWLRICDEHGRTVSWASKVK